ncbi:hypothetical protein PCANC_12572 [Puccinia coronata f. sp. avenae]|uniref:Uncharacterized protein n=1 Tax=Puccinia coronata f. sp. avenae TaxID=200324 RepID=A0A2N5SZP4_9BASI|nr:hypothetical protein PCANC_12572 [Puccinia coronata f. sp. avenae]
MRHWLVHTPYSGDRRLAVPRHIVESPVGRLDNPTAVQTPAYLPAQPRPLDLAGRLPSDVCLLPGPVGVCPANLGPHCQATEAPTAFGNYPATWDHPVRPPAAPTACRRLSSPPGTTLSGHRGPYHHPTAPIPPIAGWQITQPLTAPSGVASQPLLSLLCSHNKQHNSCI